jgi:hypothetical protein
LTAARNARSTLCEVESLVASARRVKTSEGIYPLVLALIIPDKSYRIVYN